MIRVLLVDDHGLIRRALRELLSDQPDIEVVGEAADFSTMRSLLRTTPADVILLDVNLPGRSGIEALAHLETIEHAPRALMLSQFSEDQYGLRSMKAGAMGYLDKSGDPSQIVDAIRAIATGRRFVTPALARLLLEAVTGSATLALHESLSERELQVMMLISSGRRLSQIAEQLQISPKTVSVYRARLMEKLSVGSNAELAAYSLRHGLMQ